MSDSKRPIIVRKKVGGHGGHHGGSWKVAYADFVTAMMAFFLVMWIMGMDQNVKEMVEGYFANPAGYKKAYGAGSNIIASGNSMRNMDVARVAMLLREAQRNSFERAAQEIRDSLAAADGLEKLKGKIEVVVTPEGLRIELIESDTKEVFFRSGSAVPTPEAVAAIEIIGHGLLRLTNPIVLEGHTDARPYGTNEYTNWELSVDRANAARRLVLGSGVPVARVVEVRGYAARRPRVANDPNAPGNRRVSLLLPYVQPDTTQAANAQAAGSADSASGGRAASH